MLTLATLGISVVAIRLAKSDAKEGDSRLYWQGYASA